MLEVSHRSAIFVWAVKFEMQPQLHRSFVEVETGVLPSISRLSATYNTSTSHSCCQQREGPGSRLMCLIPTTKQESKVSRELAPTDIFTHQVQNKVTRLPPAC